MTKREILDAKYGLRRNDGPDMKGFFRILILMFVFLALCILWVHIKHSEAHKIDLSLIELHPTDEEIASKIVSLASVRDTLTDTDCAEIDAEIDAWIDAHATHRIEDCSERVKEDNGIVAQSLGRAEQYAHHLDILEGQQR